jgi:hypothetical protein
VYTCGVGDGLTLDEGLDVLIALVPEVEEDVRAAYSSTQVTAHGFGVMARSGTSPRTGAGLKGGGTRRERAGTCSRAAAGCLTVVGLDAPKPLVLKIFDVGNHASRHCTHAGRIMGHQT